MKQLFIIIGIVFLLSTVSVFLFSATTVLHVGYYYVIEDSNEPNFDIETGLISDSIGMLTILEPRGNRTYCNISFPKITAFPINYNVYHKDTVNGMTYHARLTVDKEDLKKVYINFRTPEAFEAELQDSFDETKTRVDEHIVSNRKPLNASQLNKILSDQIRVSQLTTYN